MSRSFADSMIMLCVRWFHSHEISVRSTTVLQFTMWIRCIIFLLLISSSFTEDFYELLGVTKGADEREIRKAFKRKALKFHPDKNKDDDDAHEHFLRLTKAYEVLKDEDLRKKYDLYGEEGLDNSRGHGGQYHSWSYYHDSFGIYDDDPEIITLGRSDFEQSVTGTEDVWFINFYHPMCSHCHTLAPVWRKVARDLVGIVRIGAVNCDDVFHLCANQGIHVYPTLMAYPRKAKFTGAKTEEEFIKFILNHLDYAPPVHLNEKNFEMEVRTSGSRAWLVVPWKEEMEEDEFNQFMIKLTASFDGLAEVYETDCLRSPAICSDLLLKQHPKFYPLGINAFNAQDSSGHEIVSLNIQEICKEALSLLPDIPTLDVDEYQAMRMNLSERKDAVHWLIQFSGDYDEADLKLRKLPGLLPSLSTGKIFCSKVKRVCDELYISKTPAFLLFKPGGGYEMHQGRLFVHDIAAFAREGMESDQFQILTPKEFPDVLHQGSPWFIDFYAPWCPPCMKLLPEFRKASRLVDDTVNFGSIDCTTHSALCSRYNIRHYPTAILYNESIPHQYHGHYSALHIVDFVKDTLHSFVAELDEEAFEETVRNKRPHEVWVVNFYASWCHHCHEMAPQYRRFARLVSGIPNVKVAQINCAGYRAMCQREGIQSYPHVRLFPAGSSSSRNFRSFNGKLRDASSFRQWLYLYLPSSVSLVDERSFESLLRSSEVWIVDFFAPWCGHCHTFAPEFEDVAKELEGRVKAGKVNCDTHSWLCKSAAVDAYPTVKLYTGTKGAGTRQAPQGITIDGITKDELLMEVNTIFQSLPRQRTKDEL